MTVVPTKMHSRYNVILHDDTVRFLAKYVQAVVMPLVCKGFCAVGMNHNICKLHKLRDVLGE